MKIDEIENKLRSGGYLSRDDMNKMLQILAGEYSWCASRLEEVLKQKGDRWANLRELDSVKSATQADREWDRSELGKNEIGYRLSLKKYEKMLSAIRGILESQKRDFDNQSVA